MALGGAFFTDTDGNIGVVRTNMSEKVCGLLFDISAQANFWTQGVGATLADTLKDTVVEFNSLDEVVEAGIIPYNGGVDAQSKSTDFLYGIPYYHAEHFFKINGGSGRLFIAFADCSTNWNAIINMQQAAEGQINQFGVWTEQSLWKVTAEDAPTYGLQIVPDLELVAQSLANDYHAPAVILLNANTAKVENGDNPLTTVALDKIPTCILSNPTARYVAVLLGQGYDTQVSAMQTKLASCTPVGNVGAALGCLAMANVAESIGHVMNFPLQSYFPDVEFGFGNATVVDGKLTNSMKYASLTSRQLDRFDDLGYIFLMKYAGLEGRVYFNGDATCSDGDYRTIARNRVINKSRRNIRTALLPYVNSPIKVDPATGRLSAAQITVFSNLITDILNAMVANEEISGIGKVDIPAAQNILQNDTLIIRYTMVPMGTAKTIEVTEGFVLKQ